MTHRDKMFVRLMATSDWTPTSDVWDFRGRFFSPMLTNHASSFAQPLAHTTRHQRHTGVLCDSWPSVTSIVTPFICGDT